MKDYLNLGFRRATQEPSPRLAGHFRTCISGPYIGDYREKSVFNCDLRNDRNSYGVMASAGPRLLQFIGNAKVLTFPSQVLDLTLFNPSYPLMSSAIRLIA